jgi:hypothetical protein
MLAMNAYILGSRVIDELNHRAHGDFLLIRSFSELAVSAAIVAYFMWRFRSWRTGRQQQ